MDSTSAFSHRYDLCRRKLKPIRSSGMPISGNPAHLIDEQLNGHFYLGEAYHIQLHGSF
jgi:hypothetical protein